MYHPISSKIHVWITFIKLSPKFEYQGLSKMHQLVAAACQFALVDTLI